MGNPFGRNTVIALTNKSGGSVAAGDFVYIDTTNNDSFTTGTTSAYTKGIGIAQQAIASNAVGLVLIEGYAALVNVNASVTRGNFLKSYTVAKQGTDAGASRIAGTCGMFLTGGTTPDAIIWQPDLGAGSGLSDPMTTRGDIIVRNASNVSARLAVGSAATVLKSDGTDISWGVPFPTTAHAECSADVSLTADTAADATSASVSLVAGTWDITAILTIRKFSAVAGYGVATITDGSNAIQASGRAYIAASEYATIPVMARVTPGSTTTYKLRGQASTTNDKIVKFSDGSTISTMLTATRVA